MEVRIDISEKFDNDLNKLSSKKQLIINKKINYLVDLIATESPISSHLYRPYKVPLIDNLKSSLFVFKVDLKTRVILTSENDPLFGEHILTLLRVVSLDNLKKDFESTAESLYQSLSFEKVRMYG